MSELLKKRNTQPYLSVVAPLYNEVERGATVGCPVSCAAEPKAPL